MALLGKLLGLGRNEHYDRGIQLFDQGLYEEALECFAAVAHANHRDPLSERLALFYSAEAHANLGTEAMRKGAWERAEEHFRKAIAIHPHYPDLYFSLAVVLRHRLEYPAALEALNKALEINPRFAKAHFHRGIALYAMGERELGIRAMQRAVELEPGFASDAYLRGLQAHQQQNYAAAIHAFEMVSSTEIDDIQYHFRLADDLYRRGMFDEAVDEYRRALELNPQYADIRNHLGLALAALQRYDEALDEFDRALAINPSFVDAWLNRGNALKELGRIAEAQDAYRRVLQLEPDHVVALNHLTGTDQSRAA
ncbi:MAG: tetratricopeptide repeat protein [Chthonomonadales bacterium]